MIGMGKSIMSTLATVHMPPKIIPNGVLGVKSPNPTVVRETMLNLK